MNDKFTFFDLETPNKLNDRICSFGIVHMVDGEVVFEHEYYVDPEAYFDPFNVDLHGVTAEAVKDAPTFKALWPEVAPYFTDAVIVAHNARFDLTVLTKVLYYYEIEIPELRYACTWEMCNQRLELPRYSLDGICETFGIPLENHHNAMADTWGCYGIFIRLYQLFGFTAEDVKLFHPKINDRYVRRSALNISLSTETCDYIDALEGPLTFEGKWFCLTGNFSFGSKGDVTAFITSKGGVCVAQVSRKVDYLVVGALGSSRWVCGSFGTKIQKALYIKAKGVDLKILKESDVL